MILSIFNNKETKKNEASHLQCYRPNRRNLIRTSWEAKNIYIVTIIILHNKQNYNFFILILIFLIYLKFEEMISFFVGLIIGAIGVVAVEAAAVLYFIYKLNQKTKKAASFSPSPSSVDSSEVLDPQQSLEFAYKKQVLDLVLVYTCMLNFLIGRSYCVYDSSIWTNFAR